MMIRTQLLAFAAAAGLSVALPACGLLATAHAETQGVIVIVNDQPITSLDVDQRLKLDQITGESQNSSRQAALQALIDDVLKRAEAKKYGATPSDKDVSDALERMAKSTNSTVADFSSKLKAKGVGMDALKSQLSAAMGFNRLIAGRYKIDNKVDPADVDRKLAALQNDPRLKPVPVYEVLEITLPVDQMNAVGADQILQARAVEATQIVQNFKGCPSARKAAEGIFNVKIGKSLQVPADRLPPPLKAALDKAGPGKAIGPARTQGGVQVIGYCGRSTVAPQAPTRDQVENMLVNEKFAAYADRYIRELRRHAYIDYRDKSFQQVQQ